MARRRRRLIALAGSGIVAAFVWRQRQLQHNERRYGKGQITATR